jgi:inositol hexakisphosphate/diphosphoinositol-pentakisphosphate kinase
LLNQFYSAKRDKYDITKISTARDFVKFELIHNTWVVTAVEDGYRLYELLNFLANIILNVEFGLTMQEKKVNCTRIVTKLLRKIMHDLTWWITPGETNDAEFLSENVNWFQLGPDRIKTMGLIRSSWRHVRTRLYFTSLSHLNSLLFLFKVGV